MVVMATNNNYLLPPSKFINLSIKTDTGLLILTYTYSTSHTCHTSHMSQISHTSHIAQVTYMPRTTSEISCPLGNLIKNTL